MPEPNTQPAAAEPRPAMPANPARRGLGASIALLLLVLVAVGSIAFAAGRLTGPSASSATGSPVCSNLVYGPRGNAICIDEDQMGHMGNWMPGGFGGRGGTYNYAGTVTGTVQAVDSSSLTIQLAGGRTVQIALNSDTTYRLAGSRKAASAADVQAGATVTVSLTGGRTLTAAQVIVKNP
jgi:hypothetical protein